MINPMCLKFFRCPACSHGAEVLVGREVKCPGCDRVYPVEAGIPLLVADLHHLEEEIARARETSPAWYVTEQLPEGISPYRHHLRLRRFYVRKALQRHLLDNGREKFSRLLDLGCGDGTNLPWLSDFSRELHGCDYNLTRLSRAFARNPMTVLFLAAIDRLPIQDSYYDVIFFNHVLEHIVNDVDALLEVWRILKPGGLLVLGVPNEGAFWWQLAYKRNPASLASTDHVHFYTVAQIRDRMIQAGFKVNEIHGLGYGLPDWELDTKLRQNKLLHDIFEFVGRLFIPGQCSSLYLLGEKNAPHDSLS